MGRTGHSGTFAGAAPEPGSRVRFVDWLRVTSVSGLECVQALQRAGFVVIARPSGCAVLSGQRQTIRVPLAERLAPEVIATILQKADISPSRFVELLDE
jgi:hypothetical protein